MRHYRKKRSIKIPVFLAGEGKSENNYGRWLARLANDTDVPVAIRAIDLKGGGPLELVECAIEKLAQHEKTGNRFRFRGLLLDKDLFVNSEKDKKAIRLAGLKRFDLIWQNPVHEAFILRHFRGYEKSNPADKAEAVKILNGGPWPGYKPGMDTVQYEAKLSLDSLTIIRGLDSELNGFLEKIGWQ